MSASLCTEKKLDISVSESSRQQRQIIPICTKIFCSNDSSFPLKTDTETNSDFRGTISRFQVSEEVTELQDAVSGTRKAEPGNWPSPLWLTSHMEAPGSSRQLEQHCRSELALERWMHWRMPGIRVDWHLWKGQWRCHIWASSWEVKGHKGHSVSPLEMKPLAPSGHCHWAALPDRSLACIYWPSSLEMAECLLQRQQLPGTQKTATALKDLPWGSFTTPLSPALHLPVTGTGTSVWSLLSLLEPPLLVGLSGKWPSSPMSSWEMGHFLPSWNKEMATACRLQDWRWTEGQGEAWWPPEPSAGPGTWVVAKSGGAHALQQSHRGHLVD